MSKMIDKLRAVLTDTLQTDGYVPFTFSTSHVFPISKKGIVASSILVYVNQNLKTNPNYTFNANNNRLTYHSVITGDDLVDGDIVEVTFSYYKKYSDAELNGYLKSAMYWLSIENYRTFLWGSDDLLFPTPEEREENLMVIIAGMLVAGDIYTYRTPEFMVQHFRTLSVDDKIRLIIRQFAKTPGVIDYISTDIRFRQNI